MNNKFRFKEQHKILIMTLVIVAVTGFPFVKSGLCAYFPDLMYHLLRTEGVKDALLSGIYPARIYTNFYNGYGYGSPLFYPDIFLIFPAILRTLSVSPLATWKIYALILTTIGTLTNYYSIKYVCKDTDCSIAATFMIMLSQFYLADLHLRAGISEYMAFILIPVLIAGIYDFFVYDGKRTYLIGISLAGLLLCHSIMTFLGVLVTTIIFIRMLFVKRVDNYFFDKKRMLKLIITALCTILIVSYYLFPMLEQMLVLKLGFTEPWAHIGKFTQPFSSFFRVKGYFSTIAYIGIGIPVLPLLFICMFLKKKQNKWAKAFLFGGIALYLITTDLIPWKVLENTPLNMIQFTYRFWPYALSFTVFGITLILSEKLNDRNVNYKRTVLGGIIVCAILAGVFQNRMTAWATSEETQKITEEYLENNCNYVGAGEWLPIDISEDVLDLTATGEVLSEHGENLKCVRNGIYHILFVDEEKCSYTLPLIYYKGYSAWLKTKDDSKVKLTVDQSENALVRVHNDTGMQGEVSVWYEGTTIQKVSLGITLVTIIMVFTCFIAKIINKRYKAQKYK